MTAAQLNNSIAFPTALSQFQANHQQTDQPQWVGSAKSAEWVVAELGAWAMLSLLALG
jgi:hypothetical protein